MSTYLTYFNTYLVEISLEPNYALLDFIIPSSHQIEIATSKQ